MLAEGTDDPFWGKEYGPSCRLRSFAAEAQLVACRAVMLGRGWIAAARRMAWGCPHAWSIVCGIRADGDVRDSSKQP